MIVKCVCNIVALLASIFVCKCTNDASGMTPACVYVIASVRRRVSACVRANSCCCCCYDDRRVWPNVGSSCCYCDRRVWPNVNLQLNV